MWNVCIQVAGKCFQLVAEEKAPYDVTPRVVYLEACRKLGVVPASYFLRHLTDGALDMSHHGLGPDGVKPIAISLVVSVKFLWAQVASQ